MPAEVSVRVGSQLRSYTGGAAAVVAALPRDPARVADALADLDARYPGIRFRMIDEQDRIRPHIRLFVNTAPVTSLRARLKASDTLHLIGALSGG